MRPTPVLPQPREVLAAIAARGPDGDETIHELRRPQAPLAKLHGDLCVDRRCETELTEQLHCERDTGAAVTKLGSTTSTKSKGNCAGGQGIASLRVTGSPSG